MLIARRDAHLEVKEAFEVFMIDVLIAPVIDLFKEFFDVIIVTSRHFLLDNFLLTCKLQLLMYKF